MAEDIIGPGVEKARSEKKKKVIIDHWDTVSQARPYTRRLEVKGKDENYWYRWVTDDPDDIDRRQAMGYELVTDETEKARAEASDSIDNVRRAAGRYVLMRQPMELHEAYEEHLATKASRAIHGPREIFKGIAARSGVETEDHSRISRGAPGPVADGGD